MKSIVFVVGNQEGFDLFKKCFTNIEKNTESASSFETGINRYVLVNTVEEAYKFNNDEWYDVYAVLGANMEVYNEILRVIGYTGTTTNGNGDVFF